MPTYSQYDVPDSSNMVNLGVGQPSTKDLPLNWFKNCLTNIIGSVNNPEFLQYGAIPGYDQVREKLANWLSKKYYNNMIDVEKDNIFMTNGNTGALQLLMDIFMESGDEIIIEDPTYFIAKDMFEQYGLNINSVPMEDDGMNMEILEEKIQKIIDNDDKNLQNKIFIYTIPIHHNPSSITMSLKKRNHLAYLCEKYPKLFVIADEVYHFLTFDNNETLYPLAYFNPKIFSLGSFSKIIAPGLRTGWIYQYQKNPSNYNLIERLKKSAILDSSGGINPLGYLLIEKSIDDKSIDELIEKNKKTLSLKCNLMCDFIESQMKNVKFIRPKGGYFLWLQYDDDMNDFLNFAIKCKVKFHPGSRFSNTLHNYLRLSYSYYDDTDLITGLILLNDAYQLYKKIKVSLMGFNGKLGKLIKNELTSNNKFHFIEGIERDIKINELSDIIIDVSSNEGTKQLINYLIKNEINKPLLIGTTGLDEKVIQSLKLYSINNPVAIISNFSIGIKKIKKLIDEINKLNSDWKFSMHKKDYPCGTAKSLKSLLNRDCKIDSEREDEIIGYHQIIIQTDDEEIVISHNAKGRNLFAKGCLEYISWLVNKKPGLYYEMDNDDKSDFLIKTSLGNKYIISEKKSVIDKLISDKKINNDITSLILLNIDTKKKLSNLTWTEYNINGEQKKPYGNSNEILSIVKYVFETNKITNGKINDKQLFKYDDTKFYIECNDSPMTFDNCNTEFENLRMFINQLSGLSVVGISKYKLNNFYLVIELVEDIENIDSDIFTTLGSIINGEKEIFDAYNICFINIKDNNIIKTRYFDKNLNKETDGNAYGCLVVFEYLAYVNELSYDEEIEVNIILKNDIIKVKYKDNKYYIVYS